MKKSTIVNLTVVAVFGVFVIISMLAGFETGGRMGKGFLKTLGDMLVILPFAFILIGLFEAWVKRETVEKHLGEDGGWKSYMWVCLLGGMTIGPMLTALPVAQSLLRKGAALSVVLTYIGASTICRIPMTIFEITYLGGQFTLTRYLTAIPLTILSSLLLGRLLKEHIEPQAET
ncbi:MAG: permease [Spirochaetales bacterium]|nr:permease [Spirochaetales bacterium]